MGMGYRGNGYMGNGAHRWWSTWAMGHMGDGLHLHNKARYRCQNLRLPYIFRWFKFTLKPPYRIAIGIFFSAIWTLPIGIFWSNLDSRQLETCLMTSYCHFWNLSTFGTTPGPFEYFGQNWVSSENQSFLNEGVTGLRCDLGVLGSQITRLYDGTIFGGVWRT